MNQKIRGNCNIGIVCRPSSSFSRPDSADEFDSCSGGAVAVDIHRSILLRVALSHESFLFGSLIEPSAMAGRFFSIALSAFAAIAPEGKLLDLPWARSFALSSAAPPKRATLTAVCSPDAFDDWCVPCDFPLAVLRTVGDAVPLSSVKAMPLLDATSMFRGPAVLRVPVRLTPLCDACRAAFGGLASSCPFSSKIGNRLLADDATCVKCCSTSLNTDARPEPSDPKRSSALSSGCEGSGRGSLQYRPRPAARLSPMSSLLRL